MGHLVTTPSSRVLEADDAVSRLLRRSITTLVSKPLAALVDMGDRQDFRSRIAMLAEDGHIEEWPLRFYGPDGTSMRLVVTVQVRGRTLHWTLVADVTRADGGDEMKRPSDDPGSDELQRALAREVSHLAHELNQPLAAIVSFIRGTELRLRQHRLSAADFETVLTAIAEQAMRASAIVRELGARGESS